jgi:hypothetical protein
MRTVGIGEGPEYMPFGDLRSALYKSSIPTSPQNAQIVCLVMDEDVIKLQVSIFSSKNICKLSLGLEFSFWL